MKVYLRNPCRGLDFPGGIVEESSEVFYLMYLIWNGRYLSDPMSVEDARVRFIGLHSLDTGSIVTLFFTVTEIGHHESFVIHEYF